ncbi:MAG TPA: crotonase/enoyl-CoA hydratase family protein [Gammaproteobacteria bacterium]|nr:crotonase/enoyl-CoA hydratase family protein [Gammaproteobacteria bacterium]
MTDLVQYTLHDGVATITMDDGKANVMGPEMQHQLNDALDRAQADEAVVVLGGREKIFCGGFDLGVFDQGPDELKRMLEGGARLTQRLLSFPRPVLAACSGHAIAMGAFLLLATDARIGAERDYRIHVNEVAIGMALPRFAVEVSRQRLAPADLHHALVTARPYGPREAAAAGFLDEVVPADRMEAAVHQRAEALAELDPGAFTATKLRLRRPTLEALDTAIREDVSEWNRSFGQRA